MTKRKASTATLVALAGGAGSAAPASASSATCTPGPIIIDGFSAWATRYCDTYRTGYTQRSGVPYGLLYAGRNWMACQFRWAKPNPRVGTATNHWWLWTQGDVTLRAGTHRWGWFPATYVRQGGNEHPVPGVQRCSSPGAYGP